MCPWKIKFSIMTGFLLSQFALATLSNYNKHQSQLQTKYHSQLFLVVTK